MRVNFVYYLLGVVEKESLFQSSLIPPKEKGPLFIYVLN